jgi:hypothetical protein
MSLNRIEYLHSPLLIVSTTSRLLKIINLASPYSTIFPRYGEPRIDDISDFLLRCSPLNGTCEGMWINLYLHATATPIPVLAFRAIAGHLRPKVLGQHLLDRLGADLGEGGEW